jgi:hypothetical protein
MAHTCNPSYSEVRDQEELSSKAAQANSSQNPILKILNTHTKKGLVEWLVGPEFEAQYHKKRKEKITAFRKLGTFKPKTHA